MRSTYGEAVTRGERYRSQMQWWTVLGVVVVLLIVAGIVHVALTIADRRGFVYYRNNDRPPPHTIGLIEEIYQPSIEHVIEAEIKDDTEADQDASGDPEDPGQPHG